MAHKTVHSENLTALRRIDGQVKGIQRMITEKQYCVDIVNQIHAAIHALHAVSEKVLIKHIEHCVVGALKGRSEREKMQKINELMSIIKHLRKLR